MANRGTAETKESLRKRIMELERTVDHLQHELATHRQQAPMSKSTTASISRRVGIWLLVILCAFSFVSSAAALWVNRTIVDTDNWVKKSTDILESPAIRNEISGTIAEQVFTQVGVEGYVSSMLPERVQNLAGPLTDNLRGGTANTINTMLASPAFVAFWANANRSAHAGIMYSIEHNGTVTDDIRKNNVVYIENNQLVLSLHSVFMGLKKNLAASNIPLLDSLSGDRINGQIVLATIPNIPLVLAAINLTNQAAFLLPIIAIVSGAGAVLLARNKRRTLMAIAWIIVLLMLVITEAVNIAQYSVVGALSDVDSAATTAGYGIVTGSLLTISQTILVMALLLVVAGFITGPSRPATYVQNQLGTLATRRGSAKIYGMISSNTPYVISGISGIAALLIIFPLSRAPAYMITIVAIAILLSFIAIAIRQGTLAAKK